MMPETTIHFTSFPRTEPPPFFVANILEVFRAREQAIATDKLPRHLKSDEVLEILRDDLVRLGFDVEGGKRKEDKISRPVFFGQDGTAALRFEVDAYHVDWECGLEIEATRAIRGGALYRDLIQALVMVRVNYLCIGLPNFIQWGKGNRSRPYEEACRTADALYGHSRIRFPYGLILIGC
jgi:hypothetical protein